MTMQAPRRLSLLRVHPLDSPVVALAVRVEERGAGRAVLAEAGAVKFHGDRVLGAFHADNAADVAGLGEFIGDAPLASHRLAASLAQAGADAAFGADAWDTSELAELLIPASADDSLPQLAARLGLEPPSGGDANAPDVVADAQATRNVYLALVERARALHGGALRRLADLLARGHSPLTDLVAALADAPAPLGAPVGAFDESALASRLERPRSLGAPAAAKPFAPGEVGALLAEGGPFARRFPRYEPRAEQAAMAEAVARSLSAGAGEGPRHLLVEGGTGIGKSVAYLLPAVLFALRNNARVVVSTNTINLQEQLITKDVPDLLDALRGEPGFDADRFRCAQLKGKANYLCLRRWEAHANGDAGSPDEARTLAKTLAWLNETRTGDRAELRLSGAETASWDRMSASGFSACPGAREGACFYRHARDEAAAAHLLVVNHSLLLSDLQVGGSLLPDYDFLIVDEAHNLEAEATRQFGFRVSQSTVEDIVERLGALIHSFGNAVRVSAIEQARKESADLRRDEAQTPLYAVRDAWARLTADIAEFAAAQRAGQSDDGELRITRAERAQPAWSGLDIAWDSFERSIAEAADRAAALLREMESLPAGATPGLDQLKGELTEWMTDQAKARVKARSFVSDPDDQTVYWIGRGANLSLNGAPLDVAPRLREEIFDQKRAVVLTSATLTVGGGFAHVKERLGVEDPEESAFGSPFDYRKAALLCLPTDAPEPGNPRYADAVADMLDDLARMSGGRTMALFTSHAALRAAASRLRKTLPQRGIGVLAQGPDGTPQQLLARFRSRPRAILLGTASFWEGVDVGNAALKTLVVARLPFNVPTEPIFAARSEQYEKQAFTQYAVPQAALRFRQGFGRLIRGKGDRGVVVTLDSRIVTKAYGRLFLDSVPPATTMRAPFRELAPAIRQWLADADAEGG